MAGSTFGMLLRALDRYGDPAVPRGVQPLPLPENIEPQSYEAARAFGQGYWRLPAASQGLLGRSPSLMATFGRWPYPEGYANSQGVGVMFPEVSMSQSPVSWQMPSGPVTITPGLVATHELGHAAGDVIRREDPAAWWRAAQILQQQAQSNPAFQSRLILGHPRTQLLTVPVVGGDSISDVLRDRAMRQETGNQYAGLTEYLASLTEHQGRPVRMPLYQPPQGSLDALADVMQRMLSRRWPTPLP